MNKLPPLLKVREPRNPGNPSPISNQEIEIHTKKMYQFFYKTFFKYFGQHNQETFCDDVKQEIKLFILMNWNGDANYLHHRFLFWMAEYRSQIQQSLATKSRDIKASIISSEQISPMTYFLCKTELSQRLAKAKENKLNQPDWISGFYEHFKIIIPQSEYDLIASRASIDDPQGLTKVIQNGQEKIMVLFSDDAEIVVTVKSNKVKRIYTYNAFEYEAKPKINEFLKNYKENQQFWDFVEKGCLEE